MSDLGPIGRLGRYTATHFRVVAVGWLVVVLGLGFFAPRVEHALSGAGWEATGSESVQARALIDDNFDGLSSSALQVVVHADSKTVADPAFQRTIASAEAHPAKRSARVKRRVPAAGTVDLPRRAHRRHPGRRRAERQRDGARGRRPQADAHRRRRGAGLRDRRVGDVVGLQRGQPLGDAQERSHLLARDDDHPRPRVRIARRGRPAADADDPRAGGLRRLAVLDDADPRRLDLGDELRADVRPRAGHRLRAVHGDALPRRVLRQRAVGRRRRRRDDGHRRQGGAVLRRDRADLADRGDARSEPRVSVDGAGHHALGRLHPRRDAHAAARGPRQARRPRRQGRAALGTLGRAPLQALRRLGRAAVAPAAGLRRLRDRPPARSGGTGPRVAHRDALDQGRPRWRQLAHRL